MVRAFLHQLAEIGHLGLAGGDRELGQQDLAELELHVRPLGDEEGVVDGTGEPIVGEEPAHLLTGLQIVLRALEPETAGLVAKAPGLDAEQGVVGVVLIPPRVMGVVRGQ